MMNVMNSQFLHPISRPSASQLRVSHVLPITRFPPVYPQQRHLKIGRICSQASGEVLMEDRKREHLVVLVHGLNGHPSNWSIIEESLEEKQTELESSYLYFRSSVNRKFKSFSGLRLCAERLSSEINEQIEANPQLTEISFLAHSMGGLISRFACGLNFDPQKKTIFNLRPRHFLSIASPHLGCHHDGVNEVPLIGWWKKVPLLTPAIKVLTPAVIPVIYRQTGRQLFLMDHPDELDGMPLLCMLTQDHPERGYFLSALKEFQTRTCYANVSGDAMVGWANSSIRRLSELPASMNTTTIDPIKIRADPLEASLWTEAFTKKTEIEELSNFRDRDLVVDFMMKQLQSMPWCRIDVRFHGMLLPFLAHTHIQVTRPWLDSKGKPVVKHIVETFLKLEKMTNGQ